MIRTVTLILLIVNSSLCSNILFISPLSSPSHHIWNRALAWGLVEKGHNVTLLGPDSDKVKPANYTHINVEGEECTNLRRTSTLPYFLIIGTPLQSLTGITKWGIMMCEMFLKAEGLQILLNYPEDFFDLIIIDITAHVCPYGFIPKFKYAPTIAVTPFLLPSYVAHNHGNPLVPSYVPWHSSQDNTDMNFVKRVQNFLLTHWELVIKYYQQRKKEQELSRKCFGEDLPPLEQLERHVSLVLTNTDPILDLPQPLAPNLIPVGGLHTRKSQKLPQDLQDLLDKATNGVIIFSLGSNVRSDKLGNEFQKTVLRAFSKLKQTVIWKFESDIDDLPKNVIIRKWLPQNDLLGHRNVQVFIGHGGTLSTQEAIFHGVPIVCVPLFADQHLNAKRVLHKKLGVSVDIRALTENNFLDKIREVLENAEYKENMKKLSTRFKDQPQTPLERAIFWTEYVIRHRGAQFLGTPGRNLPFYVSTSLDVVAFLTVMGVMILYFVVKIFKFILELVRSKEKLKIN